MTKVLHIKNAKSIDASLWFKGTGWYFIDETSNLQWGGHTKEAAVAALLDYADKL